MKSFSTTCKKVHYALLALIFSIPLSLTLFTPQMAHAQPEKEQAVSALRYFSQKPNAKASTTPYGNNLSYGHYVQAGDAKLYYEIYGQGTPVFVLHGGGIGTPYEMGLLLDELRKTNQVIIMSTRGHGRSEIGHTPFTYEQKANDALAVISSVTKNPVIVLGFSDGAYTAYKLAAMYPNVVDRIIGIGAGTLKEGYFSPQIQLDDLRKLDNAFIKQQLQIMPEPERYQEFLSKYMSFWSKMSVGKEVFGAIKCPVQLIVGDEDDHAPVATVLEAHQLLPNSRLCVIPKAWHTTFLDNHSLTWNVISEFIRTEKNALLSSKKITANNLK